MMGQSQSQIDRERKTERESKSERDKETRKIRLSDVRFLLCRNQ